MTSPKSLISFLFTVVLLSLSSTYSQQSKSTTDVANSERRVALVIGNSSYEAGPLKNPVNDAADMAQALRELGFDVIEKENVRQNDMKRAIRQFGEKTKNTGVALFYYAGHAAQVNGENYLIPVGATIEKEEEVEYESIDVGFVLAQLANSGSRINIVILDACRNNPFARSFRSESRGLALINAPSGTLMAYATAPGSVASDGSERNGLYTQELLKNLRTPGIDVEEVFKRVRVSVRERTQGKQTPWESSSLVGSFYFRPPSEHVISQPASQVLFEEHFNNNNRGWLEFSNDNAQFAVTGGGLVIDSKLGGWWVASKPIAINQQEDFRVECKVTKVSGVNNFGYGLIWGLKDNKNYFYYAISADGQFTVTRMQEGIATRVIPWAIPNSINRFTASNKLTLEKKGNEIQFFLNDSFVGRIPFEKFFGGNVGFTVWGTQKIIFDDLVVTTQKNSQ